MNIIVCIKQVPDTTEIRLDPVKGTMIREGVPSIMNPDDKGALELALRLKDSHGAHVTAVTMGPPQAQAVLREALAMGCDRAVLLSDRKFGGADTLATSTTLAAALSRLDHDLIVAGRQAIDGDTAQVGTQIAELLDLPQVTYAETVEWDGKGAFTVRRATEDGYEIVEADAPCLVTALGGSVKPRYMNVRGIVEAYGKPVETWGFDEVGADPGKIGLAGSPTRVARSFSKGLKAPGELHELEPAQAVELIMSKLKEKHII